MTSIPTEVARVVPEAPAAPIVAESPLLVEDTQWPQRIALFGQFGAGNLGNDGSLEAMIATLRRIAPFAHLSCICSRPEGVDPRMQLWTMGWTRPELTPGPLRQLNELLLRFPYKLLGPVRAMRILRSFDAILIPGTGILDDFGETPSGVPYVVLKWSVAARLVRCRLGMVSIGAGPIRNWLSRLFMIAAARFAGYLSFRDQISRDFAIGHGMQPATDCVFPDLAFGLPAPGRLPRTAGQPVTIGLGVMWYRGWSARDSAIYKAYLGKLVEFTLRMHVRGFHLRLIIGEDNDAMAVEDLRRAVAQQSPEAAAALIYEPAQNLHDVMEQMAAVDIAVVTRFHNLVCALKVCTPAISLSYGAKNDMLMADMGLSAFCAHAERFELAWMEERLQSLLDDRERYVSGITSRLCDYAERLAEQEELLRRFLSRNG